MAQQGDDNELDITDQMIVEELEGLGLDVTDEVLDEVRQGEVFFLNSFSILVT